MEQMGFPDGVYDFKALVTGGYYFVDKTELICDLCGTKNKTIFITRPRRFGKTLNLSMIDRFFNIDYADEEDIFNGLAVSGCERCARYKNAYPVLNLNFGYLSGESVDKFRNSVCVMIGIAAKSLKASIGIDSFDDDEKRFLKKCIDRSLNLNSRAFLLLPS